MGLKSCRISPPLALVPVSLALLVWGYGGEDAVFKCAASAVLFAAVLVHPRAVFGRAGQWLAAERVLGPMAALLFLGLCSTAWASNHFVAATDGLYLLVLGAVVLVILGGSAEEGAGIAAACAAVVAIFSLYGFCQLYGLAPAAFWHNSEFASRYVNSAHFASLVAAAVPLAIGVTLLPCGRALRMLSAVTVPVNLLALLLTRSRAAWLAAVVVYTVLAVAFVLHRSPRGRRKRIAGVVIAILLIGGALGIGGLGTGIVERFRDLSLTRGQGLAQRWQVWGDSMRMIRGEPFGVGLGCFREKFLAYKTSIDRNIAVRPHNEPIQMVAELGWLCVPLLGWLAWETWTWVRRAPGWWGERGLACAAFLSGIVAVVLQSMVDFPLRLGANALLFAVLLGATLRFARAADNDSANSPARHGLAEGVGRVVALVCVAFWVRAAFSAFYLERAYVHLDRAEYAAARPLLDQARAFMPLDPVVAYERGKSGHVLSIFAGTRRDSLLRQARSDLEAAVAGAPDRGMHHVCLAWVLRDLRESKAAEEQFRRAIACDPMLGIYHAYYAEFLLRNGRVDEAVDCYRSAFAVFHDHAELALRTVFGKLYDATHDPSVVARAAPADARSQGVLRQFLKRRERDK